MSDNGDKLLDSEIKLEPAVLTKDGGVTVEYIYERTWTALNRLRSWAQMISCKLRPPDKEGSDKICDGMEDFSYIQDSIDALALWDIFAELRIHECRSGVVWKKKVEGEEERISAGAMERRISELAAKGPCSDFLRFDLEQEFWQKILGGEAAAESVLRVSRAAVDFRFAIEALCASSRERSLAITKLEEAVLWAREYVLKRALQEASCGVLRGLSSQKK
jgi:hypothetical protein